jgi:hypothetical protein
MPIYMDARTGDPTPVELTDSARVPSVGFRCSDAMNDPPVSIPVVKLASMAPTASTATLTFDTTVLPPLCTIQPCLPPPEPPTIDDVPGEGHDGDGGHPEYFPVGSIADDKDITRPRSPDTPFEFPVDDTGDQYFDSGLATLTDIPSTMDSVTRVITTPRVCGLNGDARSRVQQVSTGTGQRFSSMVDGGANICLTGTCHSWLIPSPFPPCLFLWQLRGRGHPLPIVALNVVYSPYN